ncbi:hypothetical protein DAEQUDRAFT_770922 [Daedalea quercina L-15889]|uniref:Uncharacterized protein n=1 Tax=Daedalea quercina L-15889 TaxID=1314783 RepID=A0A165KGD5_9APHY|nr:hypothetical protein DAEQUDRAFT_770922 [Daedalea quercina L-15889]
MSHASHQHRCALQRSRYIQLYIDFAISGLLHYGGDLMVNPSLFGSSFTFYFSQAAAITFEDTVIELVRQSGVRFPRSLAHLIGYAWAILWLCISAPWLMNWQIRAGFVDSKCVPVSLIDHIAPKLAMNATKLAASDWPMRSGASLTDLIVKPGCVGKLDGAGKSIV